MRVSPSSRPRLARRARLREDPLRGTVLLAPELLTRRAEAWERHYPFVDRAALEYFRQRVPRATRDAAEAMELVVAEARTREQQERCVAALVRKTEILWHLLDCVAACG